MLLRVIVCLLALVSMNRIVHGFELLDRIDNALDSKGIAIHGFASAGYMVSDHNNYLTDSKGGSFDFNEFGLNLSKALTEDLRLGLQVYSFDLGNIGDHSITLDWALLDYTWKEWMGVRLGKIKTPYGLYNEQQDYDMLRTSILLPQGIYYKYERESIISYMGAGVYGKFSLGPAGRLQYDVFYGTTDIESDGGISKIFTRDGLDFKSGEMRWTGGGRIKWYTPLDGLLFAATYFRWHFNADFRLNPSNFSGNIDIADGVTGIFSSEYSLGKFVASAEYLQNNGNATVETNIFIPPVTRFTDILRQPYRRESFYGRISYRLTDWFEAGSYYSVFYQERHDHDGNGQAQYGNPDYNGWQKDLALSTRFDITDYWLVKLELHFMDGVALTQQGDNPDGWHHRHWELFAIKTTFSF